MSLWCISVTYLVDKDILDLNYKDSINLMANDVAQRYARYSTVKDKPEGSTLTKIQASFRVLNDENMKVREFKADEIVKLADKINNDFSGNISVNRENKIIISGRTCRCGGGCYKYFADRVIVYDSHQDVALNILLEKKITDEDVHTSRYDIHYIDWANTFDHKTARTLIGYTRECGGGVIVSDCNGKLSTLPYSVINSASPGQKIENVVYGNGMTDYVYGMAINYNLYSKGTYDDMMAVWYTVEFGYNSNLYNPGKNRFHDMSRLLTSQLKQELNMYNSSINLHKVLGHKCWIDEFGIVYTRGLDKGEVVDLDAMQGCTLHAFDDNTLARVSTLKVGGQVERIAPLSFYKSSYIKDVFILSGVRSIGAKAFEDSDLRMVDFSEAKDLEVIEESAFENSIFIHKIMGLDKCTKLKRIEDNAFIDCSWPNQVRLPDNVEYIGARALKGANIYNHITGCESIDLSNLVNVKYIGSSAFASNSVKKLTLPKKMQQFNFDCLLGLNNLVQLILPGEPVKDYIGWSASWLNRGSNSANFIENKFEEIITPSCNIWVAERIIEDIKVNKDKIYMNEPSTLPKIVVANEY